MKFLFDVAKECVGVMAQSLVDIASNPLTPSAWGPASVGVASATGVYYLSNKALDTIPWPIKKALKITSSGLLGVVSAVAAAEVAPFAIAFVTITGVTYGVLEFGGDKIQKLSTLAMAGSVGLGTTYLLSEQSFWNTANKMPDAPYAEPTSIGPYQSSEQVVI